MLQIHFFKIFFDNNTSSHFSLPKMNSISAICYEQISGNYWYGQYGDFKVILMKDSGYVNATKLCKDGGKRFYHWLANDTSKRLIKALEAQLGHEASDYTHAESSLTREDQPH